MNMKQFNVSTIQEIDNGRVAMAINHALRRCVTDIDDRPADKSKRKVTIDINMVPILDADLGNLDTIDIDFAIKVKTPGYQTKNYPMLPAAGGIVNFNPDSPNDPRQGTFFTPQEPEESESTND